MGWLKKTLGKGIGNYSLGAKALGIDDDLEEYSMSKQLFGSPKESKAATPYADMLSNIQKEQREAYETTYRPLAQGMIKDVNSTKLIDTAKASAAVDRTQMDKGRSLRQRQRLGMNVSSSDQALADYSSELGRGLTNEGNINTARVKQEERNQGVRDELINVSRGIATGAMNSAVNAAQSEGNRNSANANLAAQNDAAKTQTMTSVASMALMALIMT